MSDASVPAPSVASVDVPVEVAQMPDLPKLSIAGALGGVLTAVLGAAAAFGANLSADQQTAILAVFGAVATAMTVVLPLVDANIRKHRNLRAAAEQPETVHHIHSDAVDQ